MVLILAILGASVYGISKKPASLPEVSYSNWICDQAGLLTQDARQTIQEYNTAWNKQYYAVVAVAAVDNIRGWKPEDYARELGAKWGLGANDMLLLLVKGGDWYVACGDDLADQMTDTQQAKLKTALDTPYYAGDYSQAAVDFTQIFFIQERTPSAMERKAEVPFLINLQLGPQSFSQRAGNGIIPPGGLLVHHDLPPHTAAVRAGPRQAVKAVKIIRNTHKHTLFSSHGGNFQRRCRNNRLSAVIVRY